ncbi:uncharacterized protein J3R85_008267 [Psidium guajava]|nr:uncharacterized protein J3R85_008267 [Psidium guajava]
MELVELHLPSLSNLPPHYHTTKDLPPHLMNTLKVAFDAANKSLPSWSSLDVDDSIASDPVHDSNLKIARKAVNYVAIGSVLRAVTTADFTWKYSRSLRGAGLSFMVEAMFGWTFGYEIASNWL